MHPWIWFPSDKGRSIWGGVSTLPCLRERFNVVRVRSRTLKTQCFFFKCCKNFGIIYIVMFSVMCVLCTKMSLVLGGVAWPYPCSFCMCFQVAEFDDGSSYPNSFNSGGSSSWQGIDFLIVVYQIKRRELHWTSWYVCLLWVILWYVSSC